MEADPWHWEVGDVDNFFRNHAADILPENRRARLPTSDEFYQAIHDEGVTGDCLLTAIDNGTLREEFGIKSAMSRSAVWSCVCRLRARSLGYATQHGQVSFQSQTPRSLPPAHSPPSAAQHALGPISPLHVDEAAQDHRPGENTRSGEYEVQDATGRKRRKLNLVLPEQAPEKARPTHATQVAQGYLPDSATFIDELFYGAVNFGEVVGSLPAAGIIEMLDDDRDAGLEDNNFQVFGQNKPVGEAAVVYSRIRHMLSDPETVDLTRQGRKAVALLPYRPIGSGTRPATVIQFDSADAKQPLSRKENAAYLSSAVPENLDQVEAGGEWDFLISKHTASGDDVVLPGYGESDTAEDDSKDTTRSGSDGTSMAEESVAVDELSTEEASSLIDQKLEEYVAEWYDNIEKLEGRKAHKVWSKMKKSRTLRATLIEAAQGRIEQLKTRLQKLKSRLLEDQWKTEASLEMSCRNLRMTAEDIQEQHWCIDVWGRKQEPARPTRTKTGASGKEKRHHNTDHAAERLVIPEHDRFSISPDPAAMREESPSGYEPTADGAEVVYEADDEEFHTPEASPQPEGESPDAVLGADDQSPNEEQADTPFVVEDDDEDAIPDLADEAARNDELPSSGKRRDELGDPADAQSSAEELPSPSGFFPSQAVKREPKPSTPSNRKIMSIDLTADSSSEAPTPVSSNSRKTKPKLQSASVTGNPNNATFRDVDSWHFEDLVQLGDRVRILIKILRSTSAEHREMLYKAWVSLQRAGFTKQLKETLEQMRIEGLEAFDHDRDDPFRLAAGIYRTFFFPQLLTTAVPGDVPWNGLLNQMQIHIFSSHLGTFLQQRNGPKFVSPKSSNAPGSSSAHPQTLSSSDSEDSDVRTPSRKRKPKVQRSQAAQDVRAKAVARAKKLAVAETQTGDSSQLAAMVASDRTNSEIDINPTRDDGEPPIYILDKIAKKMKPHQIKGTRFLWLEVITSDEESGGRGCVLAHTMGLGKTMQTIAFLAAVQEAAQSKEKAVRQQLPSHLRVKDIRGTRSVRVLVLCPAGLIANWSRECALWAGRNIGTVFCCDSTVKAQGRPALVAEWMRVGGCLLVGYELFQSMVSGKPKGRKTKDPLQDDEAAELQTSLLEGPEIVVADEAHNLKNSKAAVSVAAARFKTESRIALTGTPMSNSTEEIYALVSWVSPNYLGEPDEFNSLFAIPIRNGLFIDSSRSEQRKSIMRLKLLHEEIKEKVNRANIEVLRGSIPPKVEFVLFCSPKPVQVELYRRYVRVVRAFIDGNRRDDGTLKTSQTALWSMLSVLGLLVNHPSLFRAKLLEPPPKAKKPKAVQDKQSEDGDADTDAGASTTSGSATPVSTDFTTAEQAIDADASELPDEHISAQGLTPESVKEILLGVELDEDPALSSKITVFMSLLRSCLNANDKVVVFTHKLAMLDYLGHLFDREKIPYGRIDGSDRTKRMKLLEQFNDGEFEVMMVSTRAGGVGLNMQFANRVFIFENSWNPTHQDQAIGRSYRLGQKQHVYVYRFVMGGTFETNLYQKTLFKTSLAQRVVDKKNPRRNAERNSLDYIYEPRDVIQEDVSDNIDKDPEVLGKLLKRHGSGPGKYDTMIRDVKTMETLTEEIMDEPLDAEEQKVMQQEVEARKQRPKGKKAAAMMAASGQMAPPSTLSARGYMPPPPPAPGMMAPPPPSTFAGASSRPPQQPQPHPLGGLPSPRNT